MSDNKIRVFIGIIIVLFILIVFGALLFFGQTKKSSIKKDDYSYDIKNDVKNNTINESSKTDKDDNTDEAEEKEENSYFNREENVNIKNIDLLSDLSNKQDTLDRLSYIFYKQDVTEGYVERVGRLGENKVFYIIDENGTYWEIIDNKTSESVINRIDKDGMSGDTGLSYDDIKNNNINQDRPGWVDW